MDLRPYQTYFHDGGLSGFEIKDNTVKLWMKSAEIIPEFEVAGIQLDQDNSISGCLVLSNISEILVNGYPAHEFKMPFEEGEIMKLRITDHDIVLNVLWTEYPPKNGTTEFDSIQITAEKISWINSGYP